MDKLTEYVKNLKFKSTAFGGLDKENVLLVLRDLVSISEEEINASQKECNDLKERISKLESNGSNQDQQKYMQIIAKLQAELKQAQGSNVDTMRLKAYYENQIAELKKQHKEEMSQLNQHILQFSSNTGTKVDGMKARYEAEIAKLKKQIKNQNNSQDYLKLYNSKSVECQKLKERYKKRIQVLENEVRELRNSNDHLDDMTQESMKNMISILAEQFIAANQTLLKKNIELEAKLAKQSQPKKINLNIDDVALDEL